MIGRAVSPNGRHRQIRRQDALANLADSNLVIINIFALALSDPAGTWHRGRNSQWHHVFGNLGRVEGAARQGLGRCAPEAYAPRQQRGRSCESYCLDELSSGLHN